jgi:hypothetical protein
MSLLFLLMQSWTSSRPSSESGVIALSFSDSLARSKSRRGSKFLGFLIFLLRSLSTSVTRFLKSISIRFRRILTLSLILLRSCSYKGSCSDSSGSSSCFIRYGRAFLLERCPVTGYLGLIFLCFLLK